MRSHRHPAFKHRPSLSFVLLCVLFGTLWLAGGASRAEVMGQVVVRAVSFVLLAIVIVAGDRSAMRGMGPVMGFLLAALALALLQLVPLPPALWQILPGRGLLVEAARASGQAQPWRPWSIVPGATVNAAASLIVPIAALVLIADLREGERLRLPGLLLCLVVASMIVGLLQFSGVRFDSPFVNGTPGQVSGTFANRNHFALLLACGCLLAPVWAFPEGRSPGWRGPVALGLLLLFALTLLASGSRAGLGLGALALCGGLVLVRGAIRRALGRYPRWAFPALIAGILGVLAIGVLLSVAADRAVSIHRIVTVDQAQDIRSRGFSTVLAMIRDYFPVGSGLGGFDPVFRMHEPFELLKPTYFNHAHNDWLEVVLDAGLPGLLLLAAAVSWWGWASVRAWRAGSGMRHILPRLGSAVLLLIFVASIIDYPARTPTIMAIAVVAGVWLSARPQSREASALPQAEQHL